MSATARRLTFALHVPLGVVFLAAAAPRLSVLARVAQGPFTDVAELPDPRFWLPATALALGALLVLALAFAAGRAVPRLVPAVLVACCAALACTRPTDVGGRSGPRELRWLIEETRRIVASDPAAGPASMAARLRGALPHTSFRDWLGRGLPPVLKVIPDRAGPVLEPEPGDAPGTVYLALASGGAVGWVTAVGLGAGGRSVEILDDAGAPVIAELALAEAR